MKKTVYAYIHTHWDREWYREFEEFRIRLIEVFDDILNKLETNELPSFYFDGQTSALEDYLEIHPENKNKVERFIKEKRLFIGPYYCSTDSFLVDTESLIKNLQIGFDYSKKFGCENFIAYHADTFGHSEHLPNIIKYFNLNNAIFWRGLGELESEFKFNGLNSTYLIEGYFHDYFNSELPIEKKVEFLTRTLDRISKYSTNNILLPIGADHLCTPDKIEKQIDEINNYLTNYKIVLSTPFEYLNKVKSAFKKNITKEFRDTKRNFILPGILSSRVDIKQQNVISQWQLSRLAQPLQAVTSFTKKTKNYQKEIDYAYKELLKNQAHDSIYGCSIDAVHRENLIRYEKINSVVNSVLNSIKCKLKKEKELSVINLSNYELNGAVKYVTHQKLDKKYNAQLIAKKLGFPSEKVYPTNQIPITEDYTTIYEYLIDLKNMKPFSTSTINERNVNREIKLHATNNSVENEYIKLEVKNDKFILTNKKTGKKQSDFIKIIDRADIGDSYNFGPLKNDKPIQAYVKSTKLKENGHIRCVLETELEISIPQYSNEKGRSVKNTKHKLLLKSILENQNNFIEFVLNWENKSKDHLLQIEFKLDNPITETVSDDLTGIVKRDFDPNYDIYKLIPANRGVELKHNTAPLQKFVTTQNIGLITKGLQEYEINKNKLRLTLLRSTGTISNPHNPSRGTPAGPPLPTPALQILGPCSANFALTFENNLISMYKITERFFSANCIVECELPTHQILDIQSPSIVVTTIKTNENGELIVRMLNISDKDEVLKLDTHLKYKEIYILDAFENKQEIYKSQKVKSNSFITLAILP